MNTYFTESSNSWYVVPFTDRLKCSDTNTSNNNTITSVMNWFYNEKDYCKSNQQSTMCVPCVYHYYHMCIIKNYVFRNQLNTASFGDKVNVFKQSSWDWYYVYYSTSPSNINNYI